VRASDAIIDYWSTRGMISSLNWLSSTSGSWTIPASSGSLLSPKLAAELKKRSNVHIPAISRVLFEEGDRPTSLYLVGKGEVSLAIRSRGRTVTCFRIGHGSVVGLSTIVGRGLYAMTATASQDAEINAVNAETFLTLIENRPEFYFNVLQILAGETLSAYTVLAAITSKQ
jgi:CRP-like cAMP-binding protein